MLAGEEVYFQRVGGTPPASLARPIDAAELNGKWTLYLQDVPGTGSVTLSNAGGNVNGTLAMGRTVKVQSYRRAECKGSEE